jgi:hypothetical protein
VKLTGLLDRLWDDLAGNRMSDDELASSIDASMQLIPEEDDDRGVLEVGPGEDAAASVAYALRCKQTGKSEEAESAARRMYDAVDYFLVHRHDAAKVEADVFPDLETEIAHPLMQTALALQRRDLSELLTAADGDEAGLVARLRARAKAEAGKLLAEG